ncbi:centromere DNA-binding like protein [Nitzschia inconspicua]|uniref:Centromere DNA-binding like protein n=1 Tax=Nitzschia inconspicua TaxID=303405 RepID=A0A9K3M5V5_9STRA|nr:centromere DNA-binding like protein [Nitzschia inconspicua]
MVLHPERSVHQLFQLDVFKSDCFKAYVEQMRQQFAVAEDPSDVTLQAVIPPVVNRLNVLSQQGERNCQATNEVSNQIRTGFDSVHVGHDLILQSTRSLALPINQILQLLQGTEKRSTAIMIGLNAAKDYIQRTEPPSHCLPPLNNALGIPTQHYVHLGRVLGSVLAEADGDDNELIRILGNRDPKIQEKAYSSKLPMKSIRSRELALEATEVSITMLGQLSSPQANYFLSPAEARPIAAVFLDFMMMLKVVVLQDAAATMVLHPERSVHQLFQLDVFKSDCFKAYVEQMRQQFAVAEDPSDVTLQAVIPPVVNRLNVLSQQGERNCQATNEVSNQIRTGFDSVHVGHDLILQSTRSLALPINQILQLLQGTEKRSTAIMIGLNAAKDYIQRTEPPSHCLPPLNNALGIPTQHYVHLGRVLGSVLAEADGDDNELIRILGNRDPKIQEKAYSSKLPMKSIRSRELALEATEVSITMLGQLSSPQANYFLSPAEARPIAAVFLDFMMMLKVVVLQDAAATMVLHPERSVHQLFQLDVFKSDCFKAYVEQMRQQFAVAEDPSDVTLQAVIPPVVNRLNVLSQQGERNCQATNEVSNQIRTGFDSVHVGHDLILQSTRSLALPINQILQLLQGTEKRSTAIMIGLNAAKDYIQRTEPPSHCLPPLNNAVSPQHILNNSNLPLQLPRPNEPSNSLKRVWT